MIFTKEQIPWTVQSEIDENQLHFVGAGKATEKEIEILKATDKEYLDVYGYHLLDNIQDL